LKPEFVLKVDGNRPILYVIDDEADSITILHPVDGLTLALFNGRRTLGEVRQCSPGFCPVVPWTLPRSCDRWRLPRVTRRRVGVGRGVFSTSRSGAR
jgi:hypothetical protein